MSAKGITHRLSKAREATVKRLLRDAPRMSYATITKEVSKIHEGPPMSSSTIAEIKRKMRFPMLRPKLYIKGKPKDARQLPLYDVRVPKDDAFDVDQVLVEVQGTMTDEDTNGSAELVAAVDLLKQELDKSKVTKFIAIKHPTTGAWQIKAIQEEVVTTTKTSTIKF